MPNSAPESSFALRCERIERRFGEQRALAGASMSIPAQSIHALVGENGAGKSTLMNIVSGLLQPHAGTLTVFGRPVRFASPLDATASGIGMVHQHFLLADALTVAENVALGLRRSPQGWRFDRKRAEDDVARLAEESGLAIDPRARAGDLSVGLRQRVEILKALGRGAKLLLLDEPTAVLAPPEVESLFETLRKLRAAGRTLAIVTHKLDEVFTLASNVTVLRRGETVFEGALAGQTPASLAEKMIGRALKSAAAPASPNSCSDKKIQLSVRGVSVEGALRVSLLDVHAGEICGVAGVEGNGQQELAGILAGTVPLAAGSISLCGHDITALSIAERAALGLAVLPADRQRDGLILDLSLAENLFLREPILFRSTGIRWLDGAAMKRTASEELAAFGVTPPNPELPAAALSGGNQQKTIAARELRKTPSLVLACNPSRGLDVGAAADIHRRLLDAARCDGAAVLLISSDLDEVLTLSDRVFALYRGSLLELGARGISRERVGRAMVGASTGAEADGAPA
jgi:general nucleoside transport system ATP-binding protein